MEQGQLGYESRLIYCTGAAEELRLHWMNGNSMSQRYEVAIKYNYSA